MFTSSDQAFLAGTLLVYVTLYAALEFFWSRVGWAKGMKPVEQRELANMCGSLIHAVWAVGLSTWLALTQIKVKRRKETPRTVTGVWGVWVDVEGLALCPGSSWRRLDRLALAAPSRGAWLRGFSVVESTLAAPCVARRL